MSKLNLDCLILIFNELQNKHSLYSCLLVNKEWCNIVVPILWKKYSWHMKNDVKIFKTILSFLPTSSKQILSNNSIQLPETKLLNPPLFNYISFCELPRPEAMDTISRTVIGKLDDKSKSLLEQEIYKLFISQCKNLNELHWETSQPLSLFPGASECFSKLYSLNIDFEPSSSNQNYLYEMAQICKDLNTLTITKCSHDGLISLIDAQRNLKIVKIYDYDRKGSCRELGNALAKKSCTIDHLYLVSFRNIPPSFLTSFVNLKKLTISNTEYYKDIREEIDEFQQYLAISEFPLLRQLTVNGLSCFEEISLLIEKTKGSITQILISTTDKANRVARNTGMLIKAIANNCPKIRELSTYIEPGDFIDLKSLLLNCRDLQSISFNSLNDNCSMGDDLLVILTKFSPESLTRVTISDWKYSIDAFKRFFDSYRGRVLYRFDIIYHTKKSITREHKAVVTEYIKEGVIKYSNCRNYIF